MRRPYELYLGMVPPMMAGTVSPLAVVVIAFTASVMPAAWMHLTFTDRDFDRA